MPPAEAYAGWPDNPVARNVAHVCAGGDRALAGLLGMADMAAASEDEDIVYGPRLEGFDYPHPVRTHAFESQRQQDEMIYLDEGNRWCTKRPLLRVPTTFMNWGSRNSH
ncbi:MULTISPECIES: hypothetical protein [unclassified Luteimonas]